MTNRELKEKRTYYLDKFILEKNMWFTNDKELVSKLEKPVEFHEKTRERAFGLFSLLDDDLKKCGFYFWAFLTYRHDDENEDYHKSCFMNQYINQCLEEELDEEVYCGWVHPKYFIDPIYRFGYGNKELERLNI